MMVLQATSERTETDWGSLLQSVGLKIAGIWGKGSGVASLIEAGLEEDD